MLSRRRFGLARGLCCSVAMVSTVDMEFDREAGRRVCLEFFS